MTGLAEFLRMGGYAFHVWTAYGAVLLVLALNLAAPIARRRRLVRGRADPAPETGAAGRASPGGRPAAPNEETTVERGTL